MIFHLGRLKCRTNKQTNKVHKALGLPHQLRQQHSSSYLGHFQSGKAIVSLGGFRSHGGTWIHPRQVNPWVVGSSSQYCRPKGSCRSSSTCRMRPMPQISLPGKRVATDQKKKRSSSKMCTLIGKMMNHSISGIFQLLDKARKVDRKIERQLEILELAMELMAPLN